MVRLLDFLKLIISFYQWVLLAAILMSWFVQFKIVDLRTPFVRTLWDALRAVTEPLLGPIRRLLPNLGTVDISPIILWLALLFVSLVIIGDCYGGRAQGFIMPLVCP